MVVHPLQEHLEGRPVEQVLAGMDLVAEVDAGLINGGFFMFRNRFLDYIDDDSGMLETGPLPSAVRDGAMGLYRHTGFWRSMDTFREWSELNELWDSGQATWKVWDDERTGEQP